MDLSFTFCLYLRDVTAIRLDFLEQQLVMEPGYPGNGVNDSSAASRVVQGLIPA